MRPSDIEAQQSPPERLSDWLWDNTVTWGKAAYKGLIPLVATVEIRRFSITYSNVFLFKGIGLCLGSLLADRVVKVAPDFVKSVSQNAYQIHLIAITTFAELAVATFFPVVGIGLAFTSGLIGGLFLECFNRIGRHNTKIGKTGTILGKTPD